MEKKIKTLLSIIVIIILLALLIHTLSNDQESQISNTKTTGPILTINTGSAGGDVVFNGTLPLTADQAYWYNFTVNASSDKIVFAFEDNSSVDVFGEQYYPNDRPGDKLTISPGIDISTIFPHGQYFPAGAWSVELWTNQSMNLRFKLTVFYA
ncbi:hypothetical protein [Thermoplasma sp.]|uniref:hypothetical protein n=1 Tax=Thermoplasma sp. TaxID=1973142 RepID=UPI00126A9D5B|nr:hypothetical protein [Thermoplasma sp.]KAA8922353.1 MAG: hypothetical protein F6Q11_05070 [Thermoplasma sp.]